VSGRFVTFEGIEGVGKSTQLVAARDHLTRLGVEVCVTREPGGTPLAEKIRELLLDAKHTTMAPDAELLLMFAARAQHLAEKILPALAAGCWVLCDRFTDATYAYQGGGRGIGTQRVATIEQWVQGTLQPHATILLDAAPEVGLARARSRGDGSDRFEREQVLFFQRVRDAYLQRAAAHPDRFAVLDATGEVSRVTAEVAQILDRLRNED
jgi:dTMP kinase